ncbi:hypothetical protein TNCV_1535221 [Trichonephila clavipes]|uniref:Uncharacterized protein n=1 Tax=Trichonephila clavipes TaxID=2585209 RepID=A0A8X6R993_TRICX|nr:hypothetical protein TNCV_1535221 [Trichonephila clavipes]
MIESSMGMTNHHKTWDRKSRLLGVIRKGSYEGCDVDWNEKEVSNTLCTMHPRSPSEIQRNVTITGMVRRCCLVGYSATDMCGRRIVKRAQTNLVALYVS